MKKILILIAILFPTMVFAKEITKADLVEAANYYNNLCESEEKEYFTKEGEECKVPQTIEVTDDKIIITDTTTSTEPMVFEYSYVIKENGIVTITHTEDIKKGMTEEQFSDATGSPLVLIYPAMIVGKTQGAKVADYGTYITAVIIGELFNSLDEENGFKYIIVSEGVEVTNSDEYDLVIPEAEFGNYVIRVAEGLYQNPSELKDNHTEDGEINSFVLKSTFTKIDDENGTITSSIDIDTKADFTKVAGMYDRLQNLPDGEVKESVDPTEEAKPQAKEDNPHTGSIVSAIVLGAMLIIGIALYKLYGRRLIQKI